VKIHQDVKAKKSLGIHWGTFVLTYEVIWKEIIILLTESESYGEGFICLTPSIIIVLFPDAIQWSKCSIVFSILEVTPT
jgi:hypothetical protein